MKIYHVHGPIYDCFFGLGWKDWTRVLVRKDEIKVIGGKPRDMSQVQAQLIAEHFGTK